jgi:hypothetical protein
MEEFIGELEGGKRVQLEGAISQVNNAGFEPEIGEE